METFDFTIQTRPTGTRTIRTRKAQFGDGYSQEAADGINVRQQVWNISWEGNFDQARLIADFFNRHDGYKAFYWTPPNQSIPLKFTCKEWQEIPHVGSQVKISATFTQVYRV